MPALFTLNEKPAARTNRGGLDFVRTTLQPHEKDRNYVFILSRIQNFKPHRQAL